jgi:type I restriction enzyme S subunit
MSFPAYPNYKNSGIDWLGEVPSHWEVLPLKRHYEVTLGKMLQNEAKSEQDCERPYLRAANIKWAEVDLSDLRTMWFSAHEVRALNLRSGDLLVSEGGDVGRSAIWRGEVDGCLFQNSVNRVRPRSTSVTRFLYYWMVTIKAKGYVDVLCNKSTIAHFTAEKVSAVPTVLPPVSEQATVATFLDRETAKIDALIEEQRRLVALLKEKRQAVISHAVTKGLDPHAPMKDSGIEWLGEVPAHWQILPLRRVVRQFVDYRGATPNKVSEGVPLITATQIKHGRIDHSLDPVFISEEEYAERMTRGFPAVGDLLLTTEAPLGEVALVDDERVAPGQRIILMKMADNLMTSGYLHAHFRSDFGQSELWTRASGSTASGIRADRLRGSTVLVPPLDEQQRIVSHIKRQTSAFDNVFAVVARGIQLLNERRAALISAAVTGKIDVRGSAKVLPFPIDRARARGLVATEIIERCADQPTFGRVKFQKIAFLAEAHVGISELEGSYLREAAGPLDRALISDMESGAHRLAGIERDQPGGSGTINSYRLGSNCGAHRQDLVDWLGADRAAKFDKLITDFAGLSTRGAEAVATLYGVWNDALSEGASPSDDEIITGFLSDWHPEKRKKFRASDLPEWLGWMRRHGIVPNGSGPKSARQIGALL